MIQPQRIEPLNDQPIRPDRPYVLYWMQASQRERLNHALEFAARQANALAKPLVVTLGLTADYPDANRRHYAFMLQGLAHTQRQLGRRGIQLVVRKGTPSDVAAELSKDAAMVVTDRGYLRVQKQWRRELADVCDVGLVQVESDVVVPVELASDKQEWSAATLRPRILRHRDQFLVPLAKVKLKRDSLGLRLPGLDVSDWQAVLDSMAVSDAAWPVSRFIGGTDQALRRLRDFIGGKLARYHVDRSDPAADVQSHMSGYLHFGQISPVDIAMQVRDSAAPAQARQAYLEELIVRRELTINYTHYCSGYDRYDAIPAWARQTLSVHADDERPGLYSLRELERGRTADRYWNAGQLEMVLTGKMHNYMRMYWGKRIIEWTRSPGRAFAITLALNNRYELDGRDPNSASNVAWCFGLHDRPWKQRPVFGKVRYMNAAGLERKFDMETYCRWVESLPRPVAL